MCNIEERCRHALSCSPSYLHTPLITELTRRYTMTQYIVFYFLPQRSVLFAIRGFLATVLSSRIGGQRFVGLPSLPTADLDIWYTTGDITRDDRTNTCGPSNYSQRDNMPPTVGNHDSHRLSENLLASGMPFRRLVRRYSSDFLQPAFKKRFVCITY
jgi:hypothetical protein